MNNRFEFMTAVMIGNGELTDEYVIDLAQMADRLAMKLELAEQALQTLAESTVQDSDEVREIAAAALIGLK